MIVLFAFVVNASVFFLFAQRRSSTMVAKRLLMLLEDAKEGRGH